MLDEIKIPIEQLREDINAYMQRMTAKTAAGARRAGTRKRQTGGGSLSAASGRRPEGSRGAGVQRIFSADDTLHGRTPSAAWQHGRFERIAGTSGSVIRRRIQASAGKPAAARKIQPGLAGIAARKEQRHRPAGAQKTGSRRTGSLRRGIL